MTFEKNVISSWIFSEKFFIPAKRADYERLKRV